LPKSIKSKVKSTLLIFLIIFIIGFDAQSETHYSQERNINIQRVDIEPRLEEYIKAMELGKLDSLIGAKVENLISRTPVNNKPISEKTIVYLAYDDTNIYSVFLCFDSEPEKIYSTLTSRDDFSDDEDSVALNLITFPKSQQMLGFQSNAIGSMKDGTYNLSSGWDLSFDPIWYSTAQRTNNGYVVKIKVPLSTLRFPPGDIQNWNFFVYRGIPRNNEDAYFPAYSSDIANRIVQSGTLKNIEIQRQLLKVEATPFVTSRDSKRKNIVGNNDTGWQSDSERNMGIDAKFIFDDRIVADLTLNPDFSQVESDEPQVVANQRFAVFVPEKRPFFLENSSYFETPLNLLFTRKIVDPQVGLRVTGQIGDWSVAGMVIDDEGSPLGNDEPLLYVTNIRKSLSEDSFIGLFFSDYSNSDLSTQNVSLQSRIRLSERWLLESQLALLDESSTINASNGEAVYLSIARVGEIWNYKLAGKYISGEFDAPVGFIPRNDIVEISQNISYRSLQNNSPVVAFKYLVSSKYVWNTDSDILDQQNSLKISAEFPRQTFISATANTKIERLGPSDYATLTSMTKFDQNFVKLGVESALLEQLNISINYSIGDAINFQPAAGKSPKLSDFEQIILSLSYSFGSQLKLKLQYIENTLNKPNDSKIFSSKQSRLKTSYQFNQNWSLRFIVDYQKIESDPFFSSLKPQDTIVSDLLLKWESTPGTAMYFGYGSIRDEYQDVQRLARSENKERSVFFKFSKRFTF